MTTDRGHAMTRVIRLLAKVVVVTVAASYSNGAEADWQYTRWGMTLDEVLKASNGRMQRCSPLACKGKESENLTPGAFGPYESGPYKFQAFLSFNSAGGLAFVNLELLDATSEHSASLVGELHSKYGKPDSSSKGLLSYWIWRTPTDQISVLQIGDDVTHLQYKQRTTLENKGL
jgi:hypothetical protein